MAKIILSPGECFEHSHDQPSETFLLAGDVEFECDTKSQVLRIGKPVRVLENVSHKVTNIGRTDATVGCSHGDGKIGRATY